MNHKQYYCYSRHDFSDKLMKIRGNEFYLLIGNKYLLSSRHEVKRLLKRGAIVVQGYFEQIGKTENVAIYVSFIHFKL